MNSPLVPVYLILGFIGFRLLLTVFYPLFVLIHELGHAIPARLTGKQDIKLVIGDASSLSEFRFMGIHFHMSFKHSNAGYTCYKGRANSALELYFIFGTAPLISLILALGGIFLWKAISFSFAGYFVLAAAWLANFHITFSSLLPFKENSPLGKTPETPNIPSKSDLRNLIEALKQKG
jgi:hypothetical protein